MDAPIDVTVVNASSRTIKVNAPDASHYLERGGKMQFDAEEEEDFSVGTLRGGTAYYRYETATLLTVEVVD